LKENNIDVVIEHRFFFTASEDAKKHIKAGQIGNNILPTKEDIPNVVHGVNSADGKLMSFCASCTTNNSL
jgi:glyceraldehyde 3-phosphate dehydrogenase